MKSFSMLFIPVLFAGCLTHYVINGSVRLQIGNDTENYTILALSVISTSEKEYPWITEKVLPGENSKVKEEDYAGTVKIKISYEYKGIQKDTLLEKRFDGGSIFLQFKEKEGILEIHER